VVPQYKPLQSVDDESGDKKRKTSGELTED